MDCKGLARIGLKQMSCRDLGDLIENKCSQWGVPGWLSWLSIRLLVVAQVMISQFEFEPHIGLCADSVESAWDSLSLSLNPSHMLALSLSLNLKTSK